MLETWRWHDLLRVEPDAWARVLRSRPYLAALPHVARWAARGWPLIVRRLAKDDDPGMIPVALPLPPADGKQRVAAQIATDAVCERVPPQTLRVSHRDVPPHWQSTVDAVLGLAEETAVEPRVFGSLLWQRLTRLPYVSAISDLDLSWPVNDAATAGRIVHALARIDEAGPLRVDGEILLPDGSGVQWREWLEHPAEVLVKTSTGVRLRAVENLFPVPITV